MTTITLEINPSLEQAVQQLSQEKNLSLEEIVLRALELYVHQPKQESLAGAFEAAPDAAERAEETISASIKSSGEWDTRG